MLKIKLNFRKRAKFYEKGLNSLTEASKVDIRRKSSPCRLVVGRICLEFLGKMSLHNFQMLSTHQEHCLAGSFCTAPLNCRVKREMNNYLPRSSACDEYFFFNRLKLLYFGQLLTNLHCYLVYLA